MCRERAPANDLPGYWLAYAPYTPPPLSATHLTFMNTIQICPSCHSETRRLIYCAINRRLVCAESCAMTDADLFLLELVQPQSTQVVTRSRVANDSGRPLKN